MKNETHLYNRFGFGVSVSNEKIKSANDFINSSRQDQPLQVVAAPSITKEEIKTMTSQEKRMVSQKSRKQISNLNVSWLEQMTNTETALREKMTFFWHDHFACRTQQAFLGQQQNNSIRKYALGSFRDLLLAVSKDAAMLQFLNNKQNRKNSPNENFAREVMELFTLGRGNFTEEDIKNAARAFTGWNFNPISGEFVFRDWTHDTGVKTFRGKNGNFSGEDILDIILEDRAAAGFIVNKMWSYFVSQETVDKKITDQLTNDFYKSDYNIGKLVDQMITASWFYEDRFHGNRIKSPIELLVSIQLHTGGKFDDEASPLFIQNALNQVLFYPPNVGGWPQGNEWIDSSSLTFRMALPGVLLQHERTEILAKDDGDVNNLINRPRKSKINFSVNWSPLVNRFLKSNQEESLNEIEHFLLAIPTSKGNRELINRFASFGKTDEELIQRAFTGYMSLPEYQLN